jgi:DNA-binding NtrC family response regulator
LDAIEKEHIIKVLRDTGGNKKRAAEILGIERRTLYNKAKRLGIDFGRI